MGLDVVRRCMGICLASIQLSPLGNLSTDWTEKETVG